MAVDVHATEMRMILAGEEPGIDLAALQGRWTEEQYLLLTNQTNRLIEFTDGYIEVLPMPTRKHQVILAFLYEAFLFFIRPRGGKVLFAPLRVQVGPRKYREPDLLLLRDANDQRNQEAYWLGADLVAEIVSPDDRYRDMATKRADFALAGIPEYWIINPLDDTIMVLTLASDAYTGHGTYRRGETASSALLPGFAVHVDTVLDAT